MINRRFFARSLARAAAVLAAAAASGCDGGGQATPELVEEAEEARKRSMEALRKANSKGKARP